MKRLEIANEFKIFQNLLEIKQNSFYLFFWIVTSRLALGFAAFTKAIAD